MGQGLGMRVQGLGLGVSSLLVGVRLDGRLLDGPLLGQDGRRLLLSRHLLPPRGVASGLHARLFLGSHPPLGRGSCFRRGRRARLVLSGRRVSGARVRGGGLACHASVCRCRTRVRTLALLLRVWGSGFGL